MNTNTAPLQAVRNPSHSDFQLILETKTYTEGLSNLFANMDDEPLEYIQPFEMVMLLKPITERLEQLLENKAS